jgi:aspartyl/asparaginyl beta-hydroxylase (cupin superfamily)
VHPVEPPYYRIYGDYRGGGPVFHGREDCPWLPEVEAHWRAIRDEVAAYRSSGHALTPSFVPDDVEVRGWDSVNLVTYLHRYRRHTRHFPRTLAILDRIPDLTSAFVNQLGPHASLPRHNGDTNATIRCHLGLVVPEGDIDRLGLEVGGVRRGWKEGEAFAFNEAFSHWVWNETDQERIVLVFDVLRPEYRARKLEICGNVLGAVVLTALETRLPVLRHLPEPLRRLWHRALGLAAQGALRLERALGRR